MLELWREQREREKDREMAPLWPRKKNSPVIGGSNLKEQTEGRGQASNDPESERRAQQIAKAIECLKKVFEVAMKLYKVYKERQRERRRT